MPVEFCPITFGTHYIFYSLSFNICIDWKPVGGYPGINLPISQFFEITSKDVTHIMNKQQNNVKFIEINWDLDSNKKVLKTYTKIKTQIFDASFLLELISKIFELCFFELEKEKLNPNPEDIFKLYLRPCVMPNISFFLNYYSFKNENISFSYNTHQPRKKQTKKRGHLFLNKTK